MFTTSQHRSTRLHQCSPLHCIDQQDFTNVLHFIAQINKTSPMFTTSQHRSTRLHEYPSLHSIDQQDFTNVHHFIAQINKTSPMFFARRYRIHPPRNCPHDKLNIIISYDIYFSFSDYFGDNLGGDYIPSYGYWRLSLVLFCLDTLSFCPTARKGAKTLRSATALYSPNFKLPFF